MPGPPETEVGYGRNWANVSNTPFREYKHWVHEGGIATPLIAHWPAGIKREGPALRATAEGPLHDAPSHLIDILATALDLAGAEYPEQFGEHSIQPVEGISLHPALLGQDIERDAPIFFEHEGNRAVRDGRWKLVAKGVNGPWELYDMVADRTEMNNLVEKHPDIASKMMGQYDAWAERAGVVPFGSWKKKGSARNSFRLKQGDQLHGDESPAVEGRSFEVIAEVSGLPADGVIASQGGSALGWSLLIREGKIRFVTRNRENLEVVAAPLPDGDRMTFHARVTPGKLVLRADDRKIGVTEGSPVLKGHPIDGVTIGQDLGGTVADYAAPFEGRIHSVRIELR